MAMIPLPGPAAAARRACTVLAAALLLPAGCRREGGAEPPPAGAFEPLVRTVEVRLAVPSRWSWNLEDTARIEVVNGTAETLAGGLHLLVAAPVEAVGVPAGATVARGAVGIRLTLPVTLAPGATLVLRQALRTPPAAGGPGADTAHAFALRAWLTDARGTELAGAADTLRIPAGSQVVEGGCGSAAGAAVTRYGIGPVRLGMLATEVRALCPEARDTAWDAEGMRERGLTVRIAGAPVGILLVDQRVERILVDSPGVATPAGAGVGSTLSELRARYGRPCAGDGEGWTAVWFPAAPGISFALDTADVGPPAGGSDPGALPGTARVARLWVRPGADDCPRAPPTRSAVEDETP
jgi:hypothetical protein